MQTFVLSAFYGSFLSNLVEVKMVFNIFIGGHLKENLGNSALENTLIVVKTFT